MEHFFKIFLIGFFVLGSLLVNAQDTTSQVQSIDSVKYNTQKDVTDILQSLIHVKKRVNNLKSGKPLLSLVPALGYTLQTGFAGIISTNIAFYTSNSKTQKISSVLTSIAYSQYKQIILPFQASVWSKDNKYNFVIDWRYMHYPSKTYGLGDNTTPQDGYTIDFSYTKLHQSIFKSMGRNFYAGIGYYFDYIWNIQEFVPPNTTTSFQKYGLTKSEVSSGICLRLLYDSRRNQINPTNGFYSNIAYRPNFTFLGSQTNWQSLLLEFRKYIRLSSKSKNVLAIWSYNWLTTGGNPPYLLLPSTGWDDFFDTGRGYIQGRFRGKNMLYLEAEYRFAITHNGLLGGVVFANAQSFPTALSDGIDRIVPGIGTGLRIKFNKFSGANLCIDYGIGINGSHGFFVNLNEVF